MASSFESIWNKIFGSPATRFIKQQQATLAQIAKHRQEYAALQPGDFAGKTDEFRQRIADGTASIREHIAELQSKLYSGTLSTEDKATTAHQLKATQRKLTEREHELLTDLLPEAFALVQAAAASLAGTTYEVRGHPATWNMEHYPVQLLGGMALHSGAIAEMRTGEGKTLVATLPSYLGALAGHGVHVVTVNEYLAQRDREINIPLFDRLGITTGVSLANMPAASKREAYAADITYVTNNELGFDYLRDNMAPSIESCVLRGLHYAIIDEADSILIDEARTPLIISAPSAEPSEKYRHFATVATRLQSGTHFRIDEKSKTALLTDEGIAQLEQLLGVGNLYRDVPYADIHHIENALKARYCYLRDREYLVHEGQVMIVDEFTGRVLAGRRYSEGLHQAIEAKEGVNIQQESITLATITLQNLFRLYQRLSGMTGTAMTEAEELQRVYGLAVYDIPTHRPMVRVDQPDLIFKTEHDKLEAVVRDIQQRHEKGQPVLVGTTSVEKSEQLAARLQRTGVRHRVLNAKQHEQEAEIVAGSGQQGSVTIATNMAGRGTDIKLGEGVAALGGLYILGTERHDSRRIDNQLRGRSGRQGDAGETRFYISLEDNIVRIFGGDSIRSLMDRLPWPQGEALEHKMLSNTIASAQRRVESHHSDTRKYLLQYDDVLSKQRDIIYQRRRQALLAASLHADILASIPATVQGLLGSLTMGDRHTWDEAAIAAACEQLGVPAPAHLGQIEDASVLLDDVTEAVEKAYKAKTHGLHEVDKKRWADHEKQTYLRTVDRAWMQHLTSMTHLKDAVALQGYGQKDPLTEYKNEGYLMFERLMAGIVADTLLQLLRTPIVARSEAAETMPANTADATTNAAALEQALNSSGVTDADTLDPLQAAALAGEPVPEAPASAAKPANPNDDLLPGLGGKK